MAEPINKIIYFDKETIRNILQEQNRGTKISQIEISSSTEANAQAMLETKINLGVPFCDRLSFFFSGKLSVSYFIRRDSETTITSTEISEFEKLKDRLIEIKHAMVSDIENSSTFFRVAGRYLRIIKGGVDEVDTKAFNTVMDGYDGYDTYKVDKLLYVRFNNAAFVSNYKRNDLLTTVMTLYCIEVGKFPREIFDFVKQLSKMESLFTGMAHEKTLADSFPPNGLIESKEYSKAGFLEKNAHSNIRLLDVVYACIESQS